MHEPYEARRREREEKKGSVHYGWRSFRACPQRESDSWPSVPETDALSTELQGRGVVSRLGGRLIPCCMSGTTSIESSVEGKSIRRAAAKLLLLDSNQDQRFQRPVCCRLHQGGMCANASDTYARLRSAMPIQPVLLTGFQAVSRGLTHC